MGMKNSGSVRLKDRIAFATFVALARDRKESAPVKIRTSNLLIRSQMLYPVELRALKPILPMKQVHDLNKMCFF
jgi:hypothetical protein